MLDAYQMLRPSSYQFLPATPKTIALMLVPSASLRTARMPRPAETGPTTIAVAPSPTHGEKNFLSGHHACPQRRLKEQAVATRAAFYQRLGVRELLHEAVAGNVDWLPSSRRYFSPPTRCSGPGGLGNKSTCVLRKRCC